MDEGLSESLTNFALRQCLPLRQDFDKMVRHKLGHFSSAVAVKYAEHRDVLMSGNCKLCDEGVLHVLAPALHFAGGEFVVLVLSPARLLCCDGLLQIAVSH